MTQQDGYTALVIAVKKNKGTMTDLLLAHHCDVNLCDRDNTTALMHAVDNTTTSLAMVEKLLAAGADTEAQDAAGKTALIKAIEKKHMPLFMRLLTATAQLDCVDEVRRALLVVGKEQLRCLRADHNIMLICMCCVGWFNSFADCREASTTRVCIRTAGSEC